MLAAILVITVTGNELVAAAVLFKVVVIVVTGGFVVA